MLTLQGTGVFALICSTILERSRDSALDDTPILKLAAYSQLALISVQALLGCVVRFCLRDSDYRLATRTVHSALGKSFPVVGWIQCIFSAAALQGHCQGDKLGQCLAHYSLVSVAPFRNLRM